jgi:hypothetical protein
MAMNSGTRAIAQDDGFTVAELAFAAAILLIIVIGSMTGLSFAAQSNVHTLNKSEATTLANQQIEYIRNLADFNDVASEVSTAGLPAGKIVTPRNVGKYTIATTVTWGETDPSVIYARTPYKNVIVTVTWSSPTPGSITLSTRVAGKDTQGLYNRGTVKLTVKDDATPAQPVSGVDVELTDSAGDTYVLSTTTSGTVLFTGIPAGTVAMTASKDGYLITNVPASSQCVANQLNDAGTATAKKLKSGVITVLAPSGIAVPSGSSVALSGGGTSPAAVLTLSDGTATFTQSLITGSYTVGVTPPSTWYNSVSSAGNLAISTADNTALTITLPTTSVKSVKVYVKSNTSGSVYIWRSTGASYPGNGSTNKITLSGSGSNYTSSTWFTITNGDHLAARYYFTKTATAPVSPFTGVAFLNITAGDTANSTSSTPFVVN